MGTRKPTQYPCTAGSWGNLTNLEKQEDCYQCPKGWYCLEGSDKPSDLCEAGHYCPKGKKSPFPPNFSLRTSLKVHKTSLEDDSVPQSVHRLNKTTIALS